MTLPSQSNYSLFNSINILSKYTTVDLLQDEKNNLFYQVNINELLLSDITSDELINVRNNGWFIDVDEKVIRKKINK